MNDDRLSRLVTYTTFHIGVYITLVSALLGAVISGLPVNEFLARYIATMVFFAGVFGGVIGSSAAEARSYDELTGDGAIKVLGIKWPCLETCIHWEHRLFWLGVGPPALAFLVFGPAALQS